MLTLFIDISDIRALFLSTVDRTTGQRNTLTESDFKIWLLEAVNFLNLIYTDFLISSDHRPEMRLSCSPANFEGLKELYESLKDSLDHPLLQDKAILTSKGFINGDLLYFQLEVENDN